MTSRDNHEVRQQAAARQALEGGKTVDQTAATLQLPARYKAYDLSNARPFVQAMARELGK